MHILNNCITNLLGVVLPRFIPESVFKKANVRLQTMKFPRPVSSSVRYILPIKYKKKPRVKSIDWVRVVHLDILPIILLDLVPYTVYGFVCVMCHVWKLLLVDEVTDEIVHEIEGYLWTAMSIYDAYVPEDIKGGWQFHLLLHLPILLLFNGPLIDNWNFFLERAMGIFKTWAKNRVRPVESIANSQNLLHAINSLKVRFRTSTY
jgi:hypothetical protein